MWTSEGTPNTEFRNSLFWPDQVTALAFHGCCWKLIFIFRLISFVICQYHVIDVKVLLQQSFRPWSLFFDSTAVQLLIKRSSRPLWIKFDMSVIKELFWYRRFSYVFDSEKSCWFSVWLTKWYLQEDFLTPVIIIFNLCFINVIIFPRGLTILSAADKTPHSNFGFVFLCRNIRYYS